MTRAKRASESESAREEKWHGIFAVDPGGTTGVAWGIFNLAADSVGDALATAQHAGSLDVGGRERGSARDAHADEQEQALTLAELYWEFERSCDALVPRDLVIEDWQPRLPLKSGERVVFFPVRIPAMFMGILYGASSSGEWPDVLWQQPGMVKNYATDARLRRWGRWVKGSDHQRDAWRHVASRLNALLT